MFATSGYAESITSLSKTSLATDGILDGASPELATESSVASGLTATLTVALST